MRRAILAGEMRPIRFQSSSIGAPGDETPPADGVPPSSEEAPLVQNNTPLVQNKAADQTKNPFVKDTETITPPALKTVPTWMMDPALSGICGQPAARILWILNAVAALFHFVLVFVTYFASVQNGKSWDTPRLEMWTRSLTFNANSTSMLTPSLKPAGWSIPLTQLTMAFFGLSCFFHSTICIFNAYQAWGSKVKIGWTGWYYRWLNDARQPLR